MRRPLFLFLGVASLFLVLNVVSADKAAVSEALLLQAPTPGPGAMTIYAIANSNSTSIMVRHIITDSINTYTVFTSTIPSNSTSEFHLRDIQSVPNPFIGAMTLESDLPFSSSIIGYDYPSSPTIPPANTATPTPTATNTMVPTPTRTATSAPTYAVTSTPTVANTSTPTPTSTATTVPSPTKTATPKSAPTKSKRPR